MLETQDSLATETGLPLQQGRSATAATASTAAAVTNPGAGGTGQRGYSSNLTQTVRAIVCKGGTNAEHNVMANNANNRGAFQRPSRRNCGQMMRTMVLTLFCFLVVVLICIILAVRVV